METGLFILVFGVALLFIIGLPLGLGIWWISHTVNTRRQLCSRGFEVKLNAGTMPVIDKKDETTHG